MENRNRKISFKNQRKILKQITELEVCHRELGTKIVKLNKNLTEFPQTYLARIIRCRIETKAKINFLKLSLDSYYDIKSY